MKMEKENRKRIVMTACLILVLFFITVSVHAEYRDLGPGEVFGITSGWSGLISRESWIPEQFNGAQSITQHGWGFFNRDSAMLMVNMLSNITLRDKSLYSVTAWEDRSQINRRAVHQFFVYAQLVDNGVIRIGIHDLTSGKFELWCFR